MGHVVGGIARNCCGMGSGLPPKSLVSLSRGLSSSNPAGPTCASRPCGISPGLIRQLRRLARWLRNDLAVALRRWETARWRAVGGRCQGKPVISWMSRTHEDERLGQGEALGHLAKALAMDQPPGRLRGQLQRAARGIGGGGLRQDLQLDQVGGRPLESGWEVEAAPLLPQLWYPSTRGLLEVSLLGRLKVAFFTPHNAFSTCDILTEALELVMSTRIGDQVPADPCVCLGVQAFASCQHCESSRSLQPK